jgi:hypothetical protein
MTLFEERTRFEVIEKAILASLSYESWENPMLWLPELWQLTLFCLAVLLGIVVVAETLEDWHTGPWYAEKRHSPFWEGEYYGHPWLPIAFET